MNNPFDEIIKKLTSVENHILMIESELNLVKQKGSDDHELLTVKQTAELLHLAIPTIYNLVQRGLLPHMKKQKRLYFFKDQLIEWVKEGRKKTIDEILKGVEHTPITQKKKGGN